MILVNFKIYKNVFGSKAIELARIIKKTEDKFKVPIIILASALQAVKIKEETGAEVWLQNVDEYEEGQYSGWTSMKEAESWGIKGAMINHSEHQISKGTALKIIKKRPQDFQIVLCQSSLGKMEKWGAKSKPNWILYEPPELIANPKESVATKPEIIKNAVKICGEVPLMVGAGIKKGEDIQISLKMGAKAVALSSALVLSDEPEKILEEFVKAFISV